MTRTEQPWNRIALVECIAVGLFYAFLGVEKASNTLFIGGVVFILSVNWLIRKNFAFAVFLPGIFFLGFVGFWRAAGQDVSNAPKFFASLMAFIDSYENVMAQPLADNNFGRGFFLFFSGAMLILVRLFVALVKERANSLYSVEMFHSILAAAVLFLAWKLGSHRDASSYGIFLYMIPILLTHLALFPLSPQQEKISPNSNGFVRLTTGVLNVGRYVVLAVLLVTVGSDVVAARQARPGAIGLGKEVIERFSFLAGYRPAADFSRLKERYASLVSTNRLPPALRERIVSASVDEFGNEPGILLLNGINYRPRPVPIDFIAANSALKEMNAFHYLSSAVAPDYVFIPEFGARLSDSIAYLSVIFNYEAVDLFQRWIVMKKKEAWIHLSLVPGVSKKAQLGEWITFPEEGDKLIWAEIDPELTLGSSIRKAFYHLDKLLFEFKTEGGAIEVHAVSLSELRSGFLLNPLIRERSRIMSVKDESIARWDRVVAFRLKESDPTKARTLDDFYTVRFSNISVTPSAGQKAEIAEFATAQEAITLFAPDFPIPVTAFPINFFFKDPRTDVWVDGLGGLERNSTESWRWALGPRTRISFFLDPHSSGQERQMRLNFAVKKGIQFPEQTISLRVNGEIIRSIASEELLWDRLVDEQIDFVAKPGPNIIEFAYRDWNHRLKNDVPHEARNLAAVFMKLEMARAEEP